MQCPNVQQNFSLIVAQYHQSPASAIHLIIVFVIGTLKFVSICVYYNQRSMLSTARIEREGFSQQRQRGGRTLSLFLFVCVCVCVFEREREREKEKERKRKRQTDRQTDSSLIFSSRLSL